ncbi:class I SAM-dependent methyltransferase [Roseateles violae]|uniref:Class I SAM-dependent methyltransferase n=1 Tax=Roseateles violae TaxID=3058042 RepID=A0ABT8DWG5_9BURK|nr:class I SAM-dependent methyltransferase [Pelomonas sp. PFR6]MDN3920639.1 class I SAM-dependent methyltransferase [Pelomonas sp. PFR6]
MDQADQELASGRGAALTQREHRALTPPGGLAAGPRSAPAVLRGWTELAEKLFSAYPGSLGLHLGDGPSGLFGRAAGRQAQPDFSLGLRDAQVLRRLVVGRDPLRFADAYFRGDLEIEGDLFAALRLKDFLHELRLPARDRLKLLLRALRLGNEAADDSLAAPDVKAHTRQENRAAIAFHYDVSNEFYALWLDPAMVYSCAYFERPELSLAEAQTAKLEHICRKLRLREGERFLDIGCGWGALVMHAARHHGVRAHGVTLSSQQLALARQRIAAAGLGDSVTVELCDYRDLQGEGSYDKVASVGMFEHVGLRNLPQYFAKVHSLLKPAGLFLNHGITHNEEGWGQALSAKFINRYVFPDGELDLLSNVQRTMERQRFEILDVEGLRAHYALTLRHWVAGLERHHDEALQHVSESTYRIWRLYMAASALEFETGELGIYQILGSARGADAAALQDRPWTRRYMYP